MSEQTHCDFDNSTSTVEEAALYWQRRGNIWQAPEWFDRMIAKVKADALREAAREVDNTDDADAIHMANGDVDLWVWPRAARIKGEA